jgi:hypothetical protein
MLSPLTSADAQITAPHKGIVKHCEPKGRLVADGKMSSGTGGWYPGNQMVGPALAGPLPSPIFSFPSLSPAARPRVLPTRALTRGAAPSSSPALPATPLARHPVVGGACDKIHALTTSPPKSDTKSAGLSNRRPSVGEGTAPAADGDRLGREADHASDHSIHQATVSIHRAILLSKPFERY